MLEHLDVFTEWATRRYSGVKSQRQFGFLENCLDDAIKAHRAAGLTVYDESPYQPRRYRHLVFHINAGADITRDSDYIQIELFGEGVTSNSMRMVVNFGSTAAEQMGYVWQNRWVKLEGVK